MKLYIVNDTNGKKSFSGSIDFIKEPYMNLNNDLKNNIFNKIDEEKDFEIIVSILKIILPSLRKEIEELLKHPDFDPFKEELRNRFPKQYSNMPFEFKGSTYYLHPKTNPIDSLILRTLSLIKLIEEHIKANKPLKYIYKE